MADRETAQNEARRRAVDNLLNSRADSALTLTGGSRVALREALEALWDDGLMFGKWEPAVPAPALEVEGVPTYEHPLAQWWLDKARAEVEPLMAKATEYGGNGRALDLTELGRALVLAGVKPGLEVHSDDEDRFYQELGIFFYLQGKFSRWTAAIAGGYPVSDDTLLDIGVYVRMAQRIRAVGGWPV